MNNPHFAQPVVSWGKPLTTAAAAVISLHGRAHTPGDIRKVCNRIGLAEFAFLAPAAADRSWYPLVFSAPLVENEPALSQTFDRIDSLVATLLTAGFQRERIVLLGFSQGACVLAEYALRHPCRYGALLVLTGSAIGPEGTAWPYAGEFADTPVLVSGSTDDPWIPVVRMRATAQLLRDRGAKVQECYYEGSEHLVNDQEIAIARQLLSAVPASVPGREAVA